MPIQLQAVASGMT